MSFPLPYRSGQSGHRHSPDSQKGSWVPPLMGGVACPYREGGVESFEAIFRYCVSQPDFYSKKNVLATLWGWTEDSKTKDMEMNYKVTVIALVDSSLRFCLLSLRKNQ